ncbi:hypothetical protein [Caenispirillum bisanense]|uniref:hypothetical protein n=1 Tax=Caenispirillum bisanense TaxID=414052 RepID=UPI0031D727C4
MGVGAPTIFPAIHGPFDGLRRNAPPAAPVRHLPNLPSFAKRTSRMATAKALIGKEFATLAKFATPQRRPRREAGACAMRARARVSFLHGKFGKRGKSLAEQGDAFAKPRIANGKFGKSWQMASGTGPGISKEGII